MRDSGHLPEQAAHQVGVGIDDDDGVAVPARRLLPHLVGDDVVHQGGLAHAGAGHVEVMAAQQVFGEVDLPGRSGGGVADVGAAADAAGRGHEHPGTGAGHQGRLVPGARRVPEAGRLADAHDTALAKEAGAGRVQHRGVGHGGPHLSHLEPCPGGVVVVAVGRRHRLKQLPGPLRSRVGGQDRRHLKLGVEGDARDLLLDEERVVDAVAGLLDAVPGQAADGQSEGNAHAQQGGLPGLPGLHPHVPLDGGQGRHAENRHRNAVHLQGLGLVGVGGFPRLHAGPLVGLVQVGLRPVRAQGAQHQPRHDALPLVQRRQRAHEGDEGVGAGVEEVVVPERAQGDVLGAVDLQGHRPRLLVLAQAQGVVLGLNLVDMGLGVAGGDLAAHHLVVEAAGHQRHAVHVPGQLQGEGFGDGDGAEHVLDSQ